MKLPDGLENRRFSEWNYLVCGLMEVWELARRHGVERQLEDRLLQDETGMLTELLGRLGYVCSSVASLQTSTWSWQDALSVPYRAGSGHAIRSGAGSDWHSEHRSGSSQSMASLPYMTITVDQLLTELGCALGPARWDLDAVDTVPAGVRE
jgi:hypothetical protein